MPLENDEQITVNITISENGCDRIITNLYYFDRNNGGRLIIPASSSFPTGSVTAGEVFWLTTDNTLYRRNDTNTLWVPEAGSGGGGGGADLSASFIVAALTGSLINERALRAGTGIIFNDYGPANYFEISGSITAGNLILVDSSSGGAINIAVSSSVITSASHETLRQLIHFIDEGPTAGGSSFYKQVLPAGAVFPKTASWFMDSGYTQKVVEQFVTWQGVVVSQSIWQMYDPTGAIVLATVTDTTSYVSGIFEFKTTRVIS